MLDLESGLHSELSTFLDREGLLLEMVDSAGRGEIDDDVLATLNLDTSLAAVNRVTEQSVKTHFQTKGLNDDSARVVGIGNCVAGTNSQRLLPFAQRLIVLI